MTYDLTELPQSQNTDEAVVVAVVAHVEPRARESANNQLVAIDAFLTTSIGTRMPW